MQEWVMMKQMDTILFLILNEEMKTLHLVFPLHAASSSEVPAHNILQHGNSNELFQSISYTTNSFQKPATTKKEPQLDAAATVARPVAKQDITTLKQRNVLSTLATRHLPDVQDMPGLHDGSGDGDLMPRAASETSDEKMKDSTPTPLYNQLLLLFPALNLHTLANPIFSPCIAYRPSPLSSDHSIFSFNSQCLLNIG